MKADFCVCAAAANRFSFVKRVRIWRLLYGHGASRCLIAAFRAVDTERQWRLELTRHATGDAVPSTPPCFDPAHRPTSRGGLYFDAFDGVAGKSAGATRSGWAACRGQSPIHLERGARRPQALGVVPQVVALGKQKITDHKFDVDALPLLRGQSGMLHPQNRACAFDVATGNRRPRQGSTDFFKARARSIGALAPRPAPLQGVS